jgi:hypothetical protein
MSRYIKITEKLINGAIRIEVESELLTNKIYNSPL